MIEPIPNTEHSLPMTRILIALLILLLPSSALPLAIGPLPAPPAPTPVCAQPRYANASALMAALFSADYACAEAIAAALRPLASPALVDALLGLASSAEHATARRNALRVLGRLAESPRSTPAAELLARSKAAALLATLGTIVARERDSFLLQDALWILDTFYFPAFNMQLDLERISLDPQLDPALRDRAAAAVGRLIYARPGPLRPSDLAYIKRGLGDTQPVLRAQAATIAWRLRADQLDAELIARTIIALAAALAIEPPLAVATDPARPQAATPLSYSEPETTSLAARAALSRALDRLAPAPANRLAALRATYEELAMPKSLERDGLLLRAGLPATALPALAERLAATQAAAIELLGPALHQPIAGESAALVRLLILPSQAAYREYLRAFTSYSLTTDGIYAEAEATIYSYARRAGQAENSLDESLQHELTHLVTGRHLFVGGWLSPGYHDQPKGWADEGLAEVLAGATFDGAGDYQLELRRLQLMRLCALPVPPSLADLLSQRAGYDRFGSFDYDAAWAFSYYLLRERPAAAQQIYAAYRDGSYQLDRWPQIAGFASLAQAEAAWHTAITRWC